jgi:transcription elongation GreA/GreB family factor
VQYLLGAAVVGIAVHGAAVVGLAVVGFAVHGAAVAVRDNNRTRRAATQGSVAHQTNVVRVNSCCSLESIDQTPLTYTVVLVRHSNIAKHSYRIQKPSSLIY